MEEFSSPNLELVLGVKEGTNFDRVQKPTIIIATLSGRSLESKKIQPDCNPQYTTDLIWDTDKSALRKMRCNQTPIKVECFAVNENGSREKLGYILLSVRCAQIIHKDKESTIKTNWHNILGVRNDFSSCKPKLLLYLIIREKEDKEINKELEYGNLHNTTYIHPKIKPVRLQEEHLIQLGPLDTCCDIFLLTINAFAFENLNQIVQEFKENGNNNFSIVYNIFDNLIRLKPFRIDSDSMILNEKTFLSIRTALPILKNYLNVYPHFFVRLKNNNITISQSEINLSSLVNANTIQEFTKMNKNATSSMDYDCILKNGLSKEMSGDYKRDEEITRCCNLKMIIKFQYIESKDYSNEKGLTSKSIKCDNMLLTNQNNYLEGQINNCNKHLLLNTQRSDGDTDKNNGKTQTWEKLVHFNENYQTCNSKSTLCNILHHSKENPSKITDVYRNYTLTVNLIAIEFLESNPDVKNVEIRFYHPQGELLTAFSNSVSIVANQPIKLKDVKCKIHFISTADEIERLLTLFTPKINICDATSEEIKCISQISLNIKQLFCQDKMEYQYKTPLTDCQSSEEIGSADVSIALENRNESKSSDQSQDKIPETILDNGLIYKIVDELETWKERQKEMFKNELRKKEQAHLTLLNEEWQRRRECLESKLSCSVQQCKLLADNLNKTTENLRLRKIQSLEKETKLIKENEELQWKYDRKLHQLQEALHKMQSEYTAKLIHLEEQNRNLITQVEVLHEKNLELEKIKIEQTEQLEAYKKMSLSQDQTTSVLQQLKILEEKLDNAQKSKSFFKEQWGNAVKEIHRIKMENQHALKTQIKSSKEELNNLDLEEILHADSTALTYDRLALNEIQREIDTLNPESTMSLFRTNTDNQLFAPKSNLSINLDQNLIKSDSSISSSSGSDRRLQMLIEERDSLLKSGACTGEHDVIVKLNAEIRSLLMSS